MVWVGPFDLQPGRGCFVRCLFLLLIVRQSGQAEYVICAAKTEDAPCTTCLSRHDSALT